VALELGIPIAAIPTTYAGSEMTPIYGITDGRRKHTGTSASVVPRLVIYDPELTLTLPPTITASSALNAMPHAIEALYAPRANLADREARYRTLWGAHLAASALAVAGTGVHHKICHVLGGRLRPAASPRASTVPQLGSDVGLRLEPGRAAAHSTPPVLTGKRATRSAWHVRRRL
jgi:maleylacetate reductase